MVGSKQRRAVTVQVVAMLVHARAVVAMAMTMVAVAVVVVAVTVAPAEVEKVRRRVVCRAELFVVLVGQRARSAAPTTLFQGARYVYVVVVVVAVVEVVLLGI